MLKQIQHITWFYFRSDEDIPINDVPLLLRDCVCLLLQLVLSWPAPLSLSEFFVIVVN